LTAPSPAPEPAGSSGSASLGLDRSGLRARASGKGLSQRKHKPWIKRWAPERHMIELGPYVGMIIPARDVELFRPNLNLPQQGFRPLGKIAPEIGGRVGYFPIRFFGIEIEGGFAPTEEKQFGIPVNMWMARGHLIAQLGLWSVTPFVLVGGGALAVNSSQYALGDDVDPALHVGLGAKFYINRYVALRLDLRDVISPRRGVKEGATNTLEVLLGLSVTLGRKKDKDEPKPEPQPQPPGDRDGDGFLDPDDKCPDEKGVAPDGCPPPPPGDRDGDGFLDPDDKCPDEKGVAPDGCPDKDADKDGILIPDDKCPDEPETRNGFEDADGCPDQVPEELQKFNGTLEGVNFDINKATLRPESKTKLDEAVAVLKKYGTVRVEISGHTDSTGTRDHNMSLSKQRAEAVKQHLVSAGIDSARIETRGAGPDEPIDTNASNAGRAHNRRIEFRVLD
jgi:OOP family OmpA-OmpF porin